MTIRDLINYRVKIEVHPNWAWKYFNFNVNRKNYSLQKAQNIINPYYGKYKSYINTTKGIHNHKTHLEKILNLSTNKSNAKIIL